MQLIPFIRANLFLIEIIIVCTLFAAYFFIEKDIHPIKRMINGLMLVLIFGIPIFFTSITRSVFEVNKLLLLRVTTLLIIGAWAVKSLLVDYDREIKKDSKIKRPYYMIGGLKWYKTGLEIPILIWLIVNVLSTLFSQNIYVSIIGAYDRWEGILTVFHYVFLLLIFTKLVDSLKLFYWIFFSFIVSASLSSIYGILQSNGIDFMQWSADATSRAFGSINNPVHYGPYVGMMIPLAFGYMIQVKYFQKDMNQLMFNILYYSSFVLTLIVFYAMFLSWGRGTWLGFQGAMTFFLLFVSKTFNHKTHNTFIMDFIITAGMVGLCYIIFLFNFYQVISWYIVGLVGLIFAAYFLWVIREMGWVNLAERLCIITMVYHTQHIADSTWSLILYLSLLTALILIHNRVYGEQSIFHNNRLILLVLLSFAYIVFNPTVYDFIYYLLVLGFFLTIYLIIRYNNTRTRWMIAGVSTTILIIVMTLIGIRSNILESNSHMRPTILVKLQDTLFSKANEKEMEFLSTARGKLKSYSTEAIGGHSARISMWKSGIKWGLMNPLLGTGPDTIKEMYPFYRRVEYARREGGHNLTPDRLHNEYVNTFATTGFLGLIARYILVIGAYFFILIGYLYRNYNKPSYFLMISTLSGFIYYQGQVLFNFGVVATSSLNYQLMGLGLAIGYYHFGNRHEKTTDET